MTRQEQLLGEWRRRLADCEMRLAESGRSETSPPWAWMQRMYARVLRYLIRRYERPDAAEAFLEVSAPVDPDPLATAENRPPGYSRGANSAPADPEHLSATEARLRYREYTPIGRGRPARTAERIRATLDVVHEVNAPRHAAGTMTAGLSPDDWILAARCRRRRAVLLLRRELSFAGTPSRTGRLFAHEVWVRRRDLDRAMLIAERCDHRRQPAWVDPAFWIVLPIMSALIAFAVLLIVTFAMTGRLR